MKKFTLLFAVVAMLAAGLVSCSKGDKADARDLLKGVPSDASAVVVFNVRSMLQKAGCKIDGQKITPSDEVKDFIAKAGSDDKKLMERMIDGDSGIDPTVMVFFVEGYYNYLTGVVADPVKFKAMVEELNKGKFAETDGVNVCKDVALIGNTFWMNLKSGSIDAKVAKGFANLSESQSFLSNKAAEDLSEIDDDVEGWGNIAGLLNTSHVGFQQMAVFQTALQTVFEDPSDFRVSVDFEKGEAEAEFKVLNAKGKPAKCLLPLEKLDLKTIKKIQGNADMLMALSVPHKLMEQLKKQASDKSPSVFGYYLEALLPLDGTCAVALGEKGRTASGVLSTDGKNTAALSALVTQTGMTVKLDGNDLMIAMGDLTGVTPVSELAESLKGSVGGLAGENNRLVDLPNDAVKFLAVTLHNDDNSLKIKVVMKSDNPKTNFLLSLLKAKK